MIFQLQLIDGLLSIDGKCPVKNKKENFITEVAKLIPQVRGLRGIVSLIKISRSVTNTI